VFTALGALVSAPVAIIIAAVGAIALAGAALVTYWEETKAFLINIWQGIAAAFELIFAPLFWAWEQLRGIALDAQRANMNIQAPQAQGARATAGAQGAAATGVGGGGGGGALGITINVNGAGDPRTVAQMVADALQGELAARGFA
jgi:hypothetical protein